MAAIVHFDEPWWLLACLVGAVPPLITWLARRGGRHISPVSVALQCLALVLAAGALARPTVPLGSGAAKSWLTLTDASSSARSQGGPLKTWPEDVPREDYAFATTVAPVAEGLDRNATRITPALQLATARAERLAGVVIRTDGQFHHDDWPPAAASLGRADLPVLIVPLESPPPDARIARLSAQRRAGAVDLRLTVRSNWLMRRRVRVRRQTAQAPLLDRTLDLLPGDSATIRLSETPPADRAALYHASLSPADAFPENDVASAIVRPKAQRVAVVSAAGTWDAAKLLDPLGIAVENLSALQAPKDAAGWMDYAAVIVVDATGTLLSATQRATLAQYVRNGGGLVLLGAGPYGSAADRDDPLNRVAALVANPYEREPLEIIVALDASGSMAEPTPGEGGARQIKFDVAAQAVLALRRHMTPADSLRVIVFSDTPRLIYSSGRTRPDFARLAEALDEVRPAGPTKAQPALEMALAQETAAGKRRLVLLVSDLLSEPFDAGALAWQFRSQRADLAIVATLTADAADQPGRAALEQLAAQLGAPLVRSERLARLAQVFAGFLRDARGPTVRTDGGPFSLTVEGPLFGLEAESLPKVQSYLLAAVQPGAEALARAAADAVLARRAVGLGRSVSLALPLTAGANRRWQDWPGWPGLASAMVPWTMTGGNDPRFAVTVRRTGPTLHVSVDAADADGPMDRLSLAVRLDQPGRQEPLEVPLVQSGVGRYEATLAADAGPVAMQILLADGKTVWRAAPAAGASAEFQAIGADWAALNRLADLTGGRIVSHATLPRWVERVESRGARAIWAYLLAAALAAMLAEWATTRIVSHRNA